MTRDITSPLGAPFARPYSRLAAAYDATLGLPFFAGARIAFERLVRRHGIQFDSAADLGCGTGLFARYLVRRWRVPVFAVDRSMEMLREAARRPDPRLFLLHQDIRRLRLPCPVDLITANYDTLNHVLGARGIKRVLARVHDNLRAGGHFFFDLLTDCQPWRARRVYVRRLRRPGCEVSQHIHWDPVRCLLSVLVVVRAPGSAVSNCELHHECGYSPGDVGRWLLDAGFILRGVYDASTLQPALSCTPRVIFVARKSTQRNRVKGTAPICR